MTCPRDHIVLAVFVAFMLVGCDVPRNSEPQTVAKSSADSIAIAPLATELTFSDFVRSLPIVQVPFQVSADSFLAPTKRPIDKTWSRKLSGSDFPGGSIVGRAFPSFPCVTVVTYRIGDIIINSLLTFTSDGVPIDTLNLYGNWNPSFPDGGRANFKVMVSDTGRIAVFDTVKVWREDELGTPVEGTIKTTLTVTRFVLNREGRFRKQSVQQTNLPFK